MNSILSDAEREVLSTPVHVPSDSERQTWTEPGAFVQTSGSESIYASTKGHSNTINPAQATAPVSYIQQLMDFDDIRIVELEEKRSWKPNPSGNLYNMYLRLSAAPSELWQRLFAEERRFPRHNYWRQAKVEDDYLVVCCALEEMEQYHYSDLQNDVRATNTNFRSHLTHMAQQEALTEQLYRQIERNKSDLEWRKSR